MRELMEKITLNRTDFRTTAEADFFADLLLQLGYGTPGDYDSVSEYDSVTVAITVLEIE